MKRSLALVAILAAGGCSKSAANQDTTAGSPTTTATASNDMTGVPTVRGAGIPAPGGPVAGGASFRLAPDEGTLAIDLPTDAKSGTEAVAKVTVTPGTGYHVNTDYPVKLTLEPPAGVTLAKSELKSGEGGTGDATAMTEQQLVFAIKLTAAQPGSYTVNGKFKFAVCNHDSCLPKVESIAIAVAVK